MNISTLTQEQRNAMLMEFIAQREAKQPHIRFKVSDKGAVSMYGINSRFPVTLYASQWERVLNNQASLKAFILDNTSKLATKLG